MKRYDPDDEPDPVAWQSLGEDEQLRLVEAYHRRAKHRPPNQQLHAVIHVVVENQIALGDELPVKRTIERLINEGLDRHEAVHAVGTVLSEFLFDIAKGAATSEAPSHDAYNAAVERLTAEAWLASWAEDED